MILFEGTPGTLSYHCSVDTTLQDILDILTGKMLRGKCSEGEILEHDMKVKNAAKLGHFSLVLLLRASHHLKEDTMRAFPARTACRSLMLCCTQVLGRCATSALPSVA